MNIDDLKELSIFQGLNGGEIQAMTDCLNASTREYSKNETIVREGESVTKVGAVISGSGRSIKTDLSGKTFITALLGRGSYIGILLASSRYRVSPVTVVADDYMEVIFLEIDRLIQLCPKTCPRHQRIITNFIDGLAEKAFLLHERNDCLIKSSMREKILTYLKTCSGERKLFSVPLDRASMAAYLNVERCALSRELSRMKKDGLIDFHKATFKLL